MQGAEFRALTEFDENPLRFSKPICKCKSIMRIGTLTLYTHLRRLPSERKSSHFLRSWNEQNCGAKIIIQIKCSIWQNLKNETKKVNLAQNTMDHYGVRFNTI